LRVKHYPMCAVSTIALACSACQCQSTPYTTSTACSLSLHLLSRSTTGHVWHVTCTFCVLLYAIAVLSPINLNHHGHYNFNTTPTSSTKDNSAQHSHFYNINQKIDCKSIPYATTTASNNQAAPATTTATYPQSLPNNVKTYQPLYNNALQSTIQKNPKCPTYPQFIINQYTTTILYAHNNAHNNKQNTQPKPWPTEHSPRTATTTTRVSL